MSKLMNDSSISHTLDKLDPREFCLGENHFVALWPRFNEKQLHEEKQCREGVSLMTVVCVGDTTKVTSNWIQGLIERYYSADDVFQDEFLHEVHFTYTAKVEISEDAQSYLRAKGTKTISTRFVTSQQEHPRPGLYLFTNGSYFPVWKLYEDSHGAFLHTLIPGPTK
jgi:hypothetical protein